MGETAQQLLERTREYGALLAERWSKKDGREIRGYEKLGKVNFMEGITSPEKRYLMSILYENCLRELKRLNETTRMLQVGSYEKFLFPTIRAIYANLIAADLVSLQPMTAPTGQVFYFDAIYGSTKGNIKKGTKMFDARRGPDSAMHFTDEVVNEETYASGTGATGPYVKTLSYVPVRKGTVVITDGSETITDNGEGILAGNAGGSGTIDYATGATSVTFGAAVTVGDAITATYEYDSEGFADLPQIDIQLTGSPVVARSNKLRARWSLEAQQDLGAYHGMNAEVEIISFMGNEIAKEINYKIIRHLRQIAAAGTVTFDKTPRAGIPLVDYYAEFQAKLIEAGNLIFEATQKWGMNWIVGDVRFTSNILEFMPGFVAQPSPAGTVGVQRSGRIGGLTCYKDPFYPSGEWLGGFKGGSFLEAGYVHAVYVGLFTTDTIVLDDQVARKGMATRTAQKVINPHLYVKGTITESTP